MTTIPIVSGEAVPDADGKTASQHLKEGVAALTTGRYTSALASFDAAIASDPEHYLSYYRRATALLSLGRTSAALQDLDALLKLNPSFAQAHLEKAKTLAKDGELDQAKESAKEFLKLKKSDEQGLTLQSSIDAAIKAQQTLRTTAANVDKLVAKDAKDAKLAAQAEACRKHASVVLETSPGNLEARRLRANCALARGDLDDAVADWSRIAHLAPSSELLIRLSSLSYLILGEEGSSQQEAGLLHLKNCLNSDPDNKACARAHRRLRNLNKSLKKAHNFADAESWRAVLSALKGPKIGGPTVLQEVESAIKDDLTSKDGKEPVLPALLQDAVERSALMHEIRSLTCQAHLELDEIKKAIPACDAVLKREPENPSARATKGEEYMLDEKYEEAVREFDAALKAAGGQDRSLYMRLQKAQKRLKLSKAKDYYKVLGVARSADAKTIKKAFRNKAKEHHPDKGGDEKKMAQVNEAFGVLGNDELRERYDAGDDPNDPMAGAQQGHPFQQGGNPFGQFFQQGGSPFGSQFAQGGQQFHFSF
ncbi:TPR-like protein [Ceraceosorus guamensis]|uniref:TPR-like protein n=1 Tax=Ceraceosorus guamensis TaxID=1522189 RepID=A0A316WCG6_9BASI|nr:TPR-like protein [Ceraceosorus guamensis]PWN46311.1 TPR-like protein [Ceraceosorus guamensis]